MTACVDLRLLSVRCCQTTLGILNRCRKLKSDVSGLSSRTTSMLSVSCSASVTASSVPEGVISNLNLSILSSCRLWQLRKLLRLGQGQAWTFQTTKPAKEIGDSSLRSERQQMSAPVVNSCNNVATMRRHRLRRALEAYPGDLGEAGAS